MLVPRLFVSAELYATIGSDALGIAESWAKVFWVL